MCNKIEQVRAASPARACKIDAAFILFILSYFIAHETGPAIK